MAYLIDTNVFLRTLIKENSSTFTECFQLLQGVKRNKIEAVTAGIVLAEVVWTLGSYYKASRDVIRRSLDSIINLRGLKIVGGYSYSAATDLFAAIPVKYVDCLLASLDEVRRGVWTVVSYDKELDRLKVKRMEPRQVLSAIKGHK